MSVLILQVVLEGLKTFNLIYADLPVEERRRAWKDWCEFCRPLLDAAREAKA